MPTNTAAELLIRISADPSSAEASIEHFRVNFGRQLLGIGSEVTRWSAQGFGDFSRVRGAILNLNGALSQSAQAMPPVNRQLGLVDQTAQRLADHFHVNLGVVENLLNRNRQVAQLWKTELVLSFLEVLNTSEALNSSLGRNFLLFDSALGANIANAIIWQKSIGEAFRKAALQAVGAIAQEALVRAIYATALGFYLLAVQDYRGAAAAFKSAAIYAAVGGAAALAGRALAGPDVREGEQGAVARRPGEVAPELIVSGQGQPAATAPERTIQIIFQGPVYGGQAGIDELVRHISQAVSERDVNLVAYTVVRQPATRA
jgi:tetratricopeptide (TPR) repeat protein